MGSSQCQQVVFWTQAAMLAADSSVIQLNRPIQYRMLQRHVKPQRRRMCKMQCSFSTKKTKTHWETQHERGDDKAGNGAKRQKRRRRQFQQTARWLRGRLVSHLAPEITVIFPPTTPTQSTTKRLSRTEPGGFGHVNDREVPTLCLHSSELAHTAAEPSLA